jgi:protein disulfide-isomerase A6
MHLTGQAIFAGAVAILACVQGVDAGIYTKNSPVLQVDAKSFDKLINKSNYTSIVEFYAPWCGHCQNLKPAYEKAAKSLSGLANVAAIDCDDDANKQLCGEYGIRGFPTLKVLRPNAKKPKSRPSVEDYQGARTASAIVENVIDKINNHVVKVTDADADAFVDGDGPRALVFTDKGKVTPLLKSLAIEFLGVLPVGQVRKAETKTVERFGVTKFPTLVLLSGGDEESEVYDGEMKKPAMVEFLSKAAAPISKRSDSKPKDTNKTKDTKSKKKDDKKEPTKVADAQDQQTAPVIVDIPPIPTLTTAEKVTKQCLGAKSSTCVLILLPEGESAHGTAHKALETLAGSAHRHSKANAHFIPFFAVAHDNAAATEVRKTLELAGEVEIVAVNGRRGWWRHYEGDFGTVSVENWIDTIRMGEGVKSRLPEGLVKGDEETTTAAETKEEEPTETPSDDEHVEL